MLAVWVIKLHVAWFAGRLGAADASYMDTRAARDSLAVKNCHLFACFAGSLLPTAQNRVKGDSHQRPELTLLAGGEAKLLAAWTPGLHGAADASYMDAQTARGA